MTSSTSGGVSCGLFLVAIFGVLPGSKSEADFFEKQNGAERGFFQIRLTRFCGSVVIQIFAENNTS